MPPTPEVVIEITLIESHAGRAALVEPLAAGDPRGPAPALDPQIDHTHDPQTAERARERPRQPPLAGRAIAVVLRVIVVGAERDEDDVRLHHRQLLVEAAQRRAARQARHAAVEADEPAPRVARLEHRRHLRRVGLFRLDKKSVGRRFADEEQPRRAGRDLGRDLARARAQKIRAEQPQRDLDGAERQHDNDRRRDRRPPALAKNDGHAAAPILHLSPMEIVQIVFDELTDIDVFLSWDILNRVRRPDWRVRLLGTADTHVSLAGLRIPMHGRIDEAKDADAVLFSSGPQTCFLYRDKEYLARLRGLDPARQVIGSMCSGSLILGALGLLDKKRATTYPTAVEALRALGVEVVDEPFVCEGRVATAAACLAGIDLAGWAIESLLGADVRAQVLSEARTLPRATARTTASWSCASVRGSKRSIVAARFPIQFDHSKSGVYMASPQTLMLLGTSDGSMYRYGRRRVALRDAIVCSMSRRSCCRRAITGCAIGNRDNRYAE
jgi:putative intracellular protease/amidase